MTPPSRSPAPERRLAVLLSHLHPPGARRYASAERNETAAVAAEAGPGLVAFPCATGDSGDGEGKPSGGGRCVFCNIVAGTSQAFKVRSRTITRPRSPRNAVLLLPVQFPLPSSIPSRVVVSGVRIASLMMSACIRCRSMNCANSRNWFLCAAFCSSTRTMCACASWMLNR